MALKTPYRFAVVLFGEDGATIGTAPAERDWEPAHEWTRFHFQRKGLLGLDGAGAEAALIPLWEPSLGEPYCRGYRIKINAHEGRVVESDFPAAHFRDIAAAAASRFVQRKALREGELYSYVIVAYPAPDEAQEIGGLSVAEASPTVPAREHSLHSYLEHATPNGSVNADEMPVFVSRQVLDEVSERTHAEQGTETGGILIGMLWRDKDVDEIFAEVTAQIPAEHTVGSNIKLTFTAETWAAADAALRLRGKGEVYLGYWHSHPVREWCKSRSCTLEAQKSCRMAKDFFSAEDEGVLRAAFPRAYSLAIVANDTAFTDLTFSMFGNNEGITQPRGFHVLEETHGA
jgi:hypothetical protein